MIARSSAARSVAAAARAGDLVLTVGAGDVTALAPRILELLAAPDGAPTVEGSGATGGA